ncbi:MULTISPECIES: hypothetical protein [unclassified Streptomyces]|uniref:hypothetical protein n=1 Tax=unclassified Streptomyces TaxID=2593676 RepID=UPI00366635CB
MNEAAEPAEESDELSGVEELAATEVGDLLDELRDLRQGLVPTARRKLDPLLAPEAVNYATGIAIERVPALLAGADPDRDDSKEASKARYLQRMTFLRETRLATPMTRRLSGRTPRQYRLGEIARGSNNSRQTVHYVFQDGRLTSPENTAKIERFFGVLPGFCSYTEQEALVAYLRPIVKDLRFLSKVAKALGQGVTKVAARTQDLSQDTAHDTAMDEILSAVIRARRRKRR